MTQKLSPQQRANLRVCMSCEWIYEGATDCPKCGWASYGARFVYGNKAYKYKVTQQPWMNRKLTEYRSKLLQEIEDSKPIPLSFLKFPDWMKIQSA